MTNLIQLRKTMRNCHQTPSQNVLQHGVSVARYFADIRNHVYYKTELSYDWRLPEWYNDLVFWWSMYEDDIITMYQIYHDCGKPFCKIEDENGSHFPDHAKVSGDIWLQYGGDPDIKSLIQMDMDLHMMRAGEEVEFALRPEAASLLITSLCEVHSNAAMFGGIESTSFKIKWKKINKFGKRIVASLNKRYVDTHTQ